METPLDPSLLESWLLHLKAERKSKETVKSYGNGVRAFLRWCAHTDTVPILDKTRATLFLADLSAGGAEASTARSRYLALRRFATWLQQEGELPTDPLATLSPPKLDQKIIKPFDDDEIRALIAACKGSGFRDRRDEALVRFTLETMARANEVLSMSLSKVLPRQGVAMIERGKGGKGRTVPFGPQTAAALDRYLRARRTHRLAGTDTFWLGDGGKGLGYYGMRDALRYRANLAGIVGFHPHRLRHTGATRWLAAGGSEGGLMAVAGWSRRDMLDRYTRATAASRAAEEARGLNLGDI